MNTFFLADLTTPITNLRVIAPELVVAFTGVVVMLYDSFVPRQRAVTGALSIIGLAGSAVTLFMLWPEPGSTSWNGMIAHDSLRLSFSIVFLIVSAITVLVSTVWVERERVPAGEYH